MRAYNLTNDFNKRLRAQCKRIFKKRGARVSESRVIAINANKNHSFVI